jgi:NAD-dependent dihydropyrimidine dehydrogenase PreA subunit
MNHNCEEQGRPNMSEETWHGIPRNKIPWYPTIDYDKCITCGKCVDFCHMSVFATEEKDGKKKTAVENPYSCIVTCTGCDAVCPTGAIKHPSKKEFREKLNDLRKNPDFQLRKKN